MGEYRCFTALDGPSRGDLLRAAERETDPALQAKLLQEVLDHSPTLGGPNQRECRRVKGLRDAAVRRAMVERL